MRREAIGEDARGGMTRREWLATAGTVFTAAAGGLAGATGGDLLAGEPDAKKHPRLGIMSDVYARFPVEEAARKMREDGFRATVLQPAFADVRFDWRKPDWDAAKKMVGALEKEGIRIVSQFAYYNVVDPDAERRKAGEARMDFLIENWKRLGSPVLSTETGTRSAKSEWDDAPENRDEKAYLDCRAAFEGLAKKAEKTGATIAIEPYWKNVIDSVERAERLFREVGSDSLKLVLDPCNYFRKADLPKMKPMLEEIFRKLGNRVIVAHAKDVKASATADDTELPAAGLGVLDYPLYAKLLAGLGKDMDLILEHLGFEDRIRARDFVLGRL
jgi:sugar phosphate isomerase/epimerase